MAHRRLLLLVMIVLGAWMMCLTGCSTGPLNGTLVDYRRSGGIIGLEDHLIIKKGGAATLTRQSGSYEFTLGDGVISNLNALFEAAEFSKLDRNYAPSREGRDLFSYSVSYGGHTVRAKDGAIPPSLSPILTALDQIIEEQS